jgi:imidazolonepropionase-like amidohydrolase
MRAIRIALSAAICAILTGWITAPVAASSRVSPTELPLPQSRVIYRGATLIDGTGAPARKAMSVITEGASIVAVTPDPNVAFAQLTNATVVDLRGKYLLPGLIDSHQHLATPPNRRRAEALLRRDLYSGVTATRIMADDLRSIAELARAARVGEIAGPDLYFAALVAGPSFFDDPRTAAAAAGYKPGTAPWMQAIDDRTDLSRAIAIVRGTGATALKIYANLSPHLVRALTAEAHRQGLPVWAHGAVFPTLPADVIAAGPDVISHTCYLAEQLSAHPPTTYQDKRPIDPAPLKDGDNAAMAKLFAAMKARGILLDPTLRVYREGDRRAATSGKPAYCSLDLAAKLTAQAHRAGVLMSAGTDGDTPAQDDYPAVFDELELLVAHAGLTPLEAIRAATEIGARTMAQTDQGQIAPGYLANMVVLARDPIADIANMRSVVMTIKRGRRFDRTDYIPIALDEVSDE